MTGSITRAAIIAAALGSMVATPADAGQIQLGKPAPPLELTLINGSKVKLAELKGQVVVLNFWATWCVPCRRELPLLDAYYRKLQDRGLRVYAVATEGSLPADRMKEFFALLAIPSVRRIRGMANDVAAVPTNYIVDRAGVVRYAKAAALDLDDLNREIVPLLNERPPAG